MHVKSFFYHKYMCMFRYNIVPKSYKEVSFFLFGTMEAERGRGRFESYKRFQ